MLFFFLKKLVMEDSLSIISFINIILVLQFVLWFPAAAYRDIVFATFP